MNLEKLKDNYQVPRDVFDIVIKRSKSRSDVAKDIGISYYNGTIGKFINFLIKEYESDISHFCSHGGFKNTKWKVSIIPCPVCNTPFETKIGHPREQKTCSCSCSNTYFRTGTNNPNWKECSSESHSYRSTCFLYHKKKCIICGEKLVVAVHHFDGDRSNGSPENLIPLCMNHHQYYHSKYRYIVEQKIKDYRDNFIKDRVHQ